MKYSLRSLMVLVFVGPPLLAASYWFVTDERWRLAVILLAIGGSFVCTWLGVTWFLAGLVVGPQSRKPSLPNSSAPTPNPP
jgi:hypothetical protein